MKKEHFFLLAILFFSFNIQAQDLKIKWSETMAMKSKKSPDGFFHSFLGETDKFIYARFNKVKNFSKSVLNEQQKVVAFDKETMKRKSAIELIGYPTINKEAKQYKNLSYHKTLFYNDYIYFFYTSKDKESKHLLVKGYSPDLKLLKPLTVVATVKAFNKKQKHKSAVPFVIGNSDLKRIIIGIEQEATSNSDIKLEYKVLSSDFKLIKSNELTLPIKYKDGSRNRLYGGSYRLQKRNRFLFNAGSIEYMIDLKSYEVKTVSITASGKAIRSIRKKVIGNQTMVYGFYRDLSKGKKRKGTDGVFHAVLNDDHQLENMVFSRFSKKLLSGMFKKGEKTSKTVSYNTYSDSDYGALSFFYTLEKTVIDKEGNVYLISSMMRDFQKERCYTDSKGNRKCKTYNHCEKSNVTIFKLNKSGKLEWGVNKGRVKIYSLWSVHDIDVIQDDNSLYIIYGTQNKKNAGVNEKRTNPIKYIQVSKSDGEITEKLLKVNEANTPKKLTKRIIPGFDMRTIDNKIYVYFSKAKGIGFWGVIEPKQ